MGKNNHPRRQVIPAVRSLDELPAAIAANGQSIFLLAGDLQSLSVASKELHRHRKSFFIHLDLMEGLRSDSSGMRYVREEFAPAGIISTRPAVLRLAHQMEMLAILRVFAIDSHALETGKLHMDSCSPEFVEVLPAAPQIVRLAVQTFTGVPVIAGGLIRTTEDVAGALAAGAAAVSTSSHNLWTE